MTSRDVAVCFIKKHRAFDEFTCYRTHRRKKEFVASEIDVN